MDTKIIGSLDQKTKRKQKKETKANKQEKQKMNVNNKRKREEKVIDLSDEEEEESDVCDVALDSTLLVIKEEDKVESMEERHAKRVKQMHDAKADSDERKKRRDEEDKELMEARMGTDFIETMCGIKDTEVMRAMLDHYKNLTNKEEEPVWYTEWVEEDCEDEDDPQEAEKKLYEDRIMPVEVLKEALEEAKTIEWKESRSI